MPRLRSVQSDNSEGDMEVLAEQELLKLYRQYRIMEGDRIAYTEESQVVLRKQRLEINQLELEKQTLLKELRLSECRKNQVIDADNADTLVTLADAKEEYNKDIDDEKKRCGELGAKIRECERKIRQQHRNIGGVHMSAQHMVQTQKTLRTLENRLDLSKCKFSTMLTENAKMRDEIESLRIERIRFDQLYKKLDKELTGLCRQKGHLIEVATQAYCSRDEAQQKMLILKEKAEKDLQIHNGDMKEYLRIIDHDRSLRSFMGIKGQERQEDPQLVIWRQRKEAIETEHKKESQEDSVETFEVAFERIKQMTGLQDLDELVRRFIDVEDKNFALFNFVNEQNNAIEQLCEDIQMIRNDIDKFRQQGLELEDERKRILTELEKHQAQCSKDADDYEKKNTEIFKILDQLRRGVESLFIKISCDRSAIDEMLGAASGVTDSNMIQYLGIIEQRSNQLIAIQSYVMSKDEEMYEKDQMPVGQTTPQVLYPILPPSLGEEYNGDVATVNEEESIPLTRNELQRQVMKTVMKRESAARKEGFKYDITANKEKGRGKKDKK